MDIQLVDAWEPPRPVIDKDEETGLWGFWDECWSTFYGGYVMRLDALAACDRYALWLDTGRSVCVALVLAPIVDVKVIVTREEIEDSTSPRNYLIERMTELAGIMNPRNLVPYWIVQYLHDETDAVVLFIKYYRKGHWIPRHPEMPTTLHGGQPLPR